MIGRLRLLAYSAWHTHPPQLAARLRLELQRRAACWTARIAPPVLPDVPLATATEPPLPLFAPREHLLTGGAEPAAILAGRPWPLATPMDWQPSELGERLELLQLHGMEYLEAADDALFERTVRDWIARNPPFGWRYWRRGWNGYALSIRVVIWMQQLARRRARLGAAFTTLALRSIRQQLDFLARHLEVDIGGNHLVRNVRALLWAGRFFHGAQADEWRRLGEGLMAHELDAQILADGCHFEASPAYHLAVFADLLECCHVLPAGALRDRLRRELRAMAQAAADLAHADGLPSQFNDGWLHMAYTPAECLAVYERVCAPRPEPRRVFALRSAGYFGARAGGNVVIVDAGRVGPDHLPAHSHGDIFSFEWSVAGERLIVDAGVSEYRPGPWRAYARSTAAHNTVTLDDQDQCEFWQAFRVARRAAVTGRAFRETASGFELEAGHDGYRRLRGRPRHVRRFDATPARLRIDDAVHGGRGQRVRARLLLHPDVVVHRTAGGVRLTRGAAVVELRTTHAVSEARGWWSPEFNTRIPTTQLVLDYGTAPCRGGFELAAVPEHDRPGAIDAHPLRQPVLSA